MVKSNNLKANFTYDENGNTLDEIIIHIYKKVLLPQSKKTVDFTEKNSKIDNRINSCLLNRVGTEERWPLNINTILKQVIQQSFASWYLERY